LVGVSVQVESVPLEHLVREPERAAVQVVAEHDVIARVAQVQHGVRRGQPTSERERVLAAFQRCQAALQRIPRGVARARIFESLVLSRPLLRIRRGQVDGRHHGAGGRVGPLPRVDGERLETIGVSSRHGAQ